ncbi:MAG: sterol desaturase family protein [Pseudomonadota bacterium]
MLYISLFVGTILATEVFAWITHRYLMHGPLWFIHKTHHQERKGLFELNDVFGLIFALPSTWLIFEGFRGNPSALAVGGGIFAYGLIYFFMHDMLVHKRADIGLRPKTGYLARIVQAHRLHHAVESREGCVSFGFIFAPSPRRLKAMLKRTQSAEMRSPKRVAAE